MRIVIALLLASLPCRADQAAEPSESVLKEIARLARENYVDPVDAGFEARLLKEGTSTLKALDPHTSWVSPEEGKEMAVSSAGKFGGVGMVVEMKDGWLTVQSPIPGTPAYKAKVVAGDRVVAIDGQSTQGQTLKALVDRLRGEPGTEVAVRVERAGASKPVELKITRAVITIQTARAMMIGPETGYAQVSSFAQTTAKDLSGLLSGLEKRGMKRLVLDLRDNPGGLLTVSIEIANLFLPKNSLVASSRGRKSGSMDHKATEAPAFPGLPLAILHNGGSAAGSEILLGALQDHGRAITLGTPTYGKGSVQSLFTLSDKSTLRLTSARYVLPKGRTPALGGLAPDIEVAVDKDVETAGRQYRDRLLGAGAPVPSVDPNEEPALARAIEAVARLTGPSARLSSDDLAELRQAASGRPSAPPALSAALSLEDDSKNGILETEESALLKVAVSNAGAGTAYRVSAELQPASLPGLAYPAKASVGRLDPKDSKTVEFKISAGMDVPSGEAVLTVSVAEANGFDAAPAKVRFKTRAFSAPKLALGDFGTKDADGDGKVEIGELADLTVRLTNEGEGPARGVSVALAKSDPNLFIQGESKAALGDLLPGQSKDASFTVFTNTRFKGARMELTATASENRGRYGAAFPLTVPVNAPGRTLDELVVEGKDEARPDALPSLRVDVDEPPAQRGPARPDALAVVLGIEDYRKVGPVAFAKRDATIFKDYAVRVLGVPDSKASLHLLTEDVTLGEFKKAFGANGWLARRVKPTSDVYVYYAGHGAPELGSRRGFLIPQDGDPNYAEDTGYSIDELYRFLDGLKARSVTVFLDACFSGADRDNKMLLAQARPLMIKVAAPSKGKNVTVFSAASGSQISSAYPEKRHGLFTYFLLKGLRGEADSDGDRRLTAGELAGFLKAKVGSTAAGMDREQTPELSGDGARLLLP